MSPGGKPLLLAQPELFVPLIPAFALSDPPFLLTHLLFLFPPLRSARTRARGVGRSDRAAFTVTLC
jgi:hypothetical protein